MQLFVREGPSGFWFQMQHQEKLPSVCFMKIFNWWLEEYLNNCSVPDQLIKGLFCENGLQEKCLARSCTECKKLDIKVILCEKSFNL